MRILFIVLPALTLMSTLPTGAETIHVPADSATIQAGINGAVNGDTVLVAPGTYTGAGNRDIEFGGKLIVVRSEAGAAVTVIDCEATESDPHRAFQLSSGEDSTAVIDGFTIRGGYGSGAGVYCIAAAPKISRCIFIENISAGSGGAISCSMMFDEVNPIVDSCTFRRNWAATQGGAAWCGTRVTFRDCEFVNNGAGNTGAAIVCYSRGIAELERCRVDSNSYQSAHSAIMLFGGGEAYVNDCSFTGNDAFSGGAITSTDNSSLSIRRTTFNNNHAENSNGAVYSQRSDVLIDSCTFSENSCSDIGTGCLMFYDCHGVTVSNSVFTRNTGHSGGACSMWLTDAAFHGCTFVENSATHGAAFWLDGSTLDLRNTIVAFSTLGGACYHQTTQGPSSATVACSDIYDNSGGDWLSVFAGQSGVNNNLSQDPLFCDAAEDNYHIMTTSPCCGSNTPCNTLIGALDPACTPVGVDEPDDMPGGFSVHQNYPNPFNGSTRIEFSLSRRSYVRAAVYNLLGQEVAVLTEGYHSPGDHDLRWDGADAQSNAVASGLYLLHLAAEGSSRSIRMVLLR